MSAILSQADLSRGDLRLLLTNDLGYRIDPFSVKWTIFSDSGKRISGERLPAVRVGTGDYYAPWHACAKSGCHRIVWYYQLQPGCGFQSFSDSFFVLNASQYACCGTASCSSIEPGSGCMTFFTGSLLGRGDLSLFLKDDDGIPIDAYSVTWQIVNASGCPVTPEYQAVQVTVGEYYANWFVNVGSGNFTILWKVLETSQSPVELFPLSFSVVSSCVNVTCGFPSGNYSPPDTNICCPSPYIHISNPCPPQSISPSPSPMPSNCCDFEIPRVVHLAEQNLPVGGAFSAQPVYNIPARIRKISFYIRYRRNFVGGRAALKLLWGNGVEEVQSTMIDQGFVDVNDTSYQNMLLSVYNGPAPIDDNFILFQVEAVVPGGSKTVRLLAAEAGQPGFPGIAEITLTAST